ncbi:MAG TPA: hypothetical protein VII06_22895 [Chloroflexota bacterium]|jgi:photosystem II stability/assembly factor-like uncharacterized protein
MTKERMVYLGTAGGVFEARGNGGAWETRPLGLQGKGLVALVADHKNHRRIFAGTGRGGVWRSDDGGQTWQDITGDILYRTVFSLVQHPNTGELYVGTEPASVFKSADGGESWTDCEQLRTLPTTVDWTFPNPPHVAHVKEMGLCADDPSLIFCAVEEGWLVRSRDGGQTWENIKDGVDFDSHAVSYMPDDPSIVIACTGQGMFRSTDGGDHFADANNGLTRRYLAPIAVRPDAPRVLYAGASEGVPPMWRKRPQGADAGFYRSEDQGASWEELRGGVDTVIKGAPRALTIDPADPDTIFVGTGQGDGAVWLTENGGESFRQILGDLPFVRSIVLANR